MSIRQATLVMPVPSFHPAAQPGQPLGDGLRAGGCDIIGDRAIGQEDHPVGVASRHRIVRHHDYGLAAGVHRLAQQPQDIRGGVAVERTGRLVAEDDLRPGHQGPGDRDPLLLAARQLCRAVARDGPPDRRAGGRP